MQLLNKLKREVQHLKEILNLRRNKNELDIQRELLSLKEQNFRLQELASKGQEVNALIKENQKLKQQLNISKIPQNSDGFIAWQKWGPDVTVTQNPMSQTCFNTTNKPNNLFLTEPDMVSLNRSILDSKLSVRILFQKVLEMKVMI